MYILLIGEYKDQFNYYLLLQLNTIINYTYNTFSSKTFVIHESISLFKINIKIDRNKIFNFFAL